LFKAVSFRTDRLAFYVCFEFSINFALKVKLLKLQGWDLTGGISNLLLEQLLQTKKKFFQTRRQENTR